MSARRLIIGFAVAAPILAVLLWPISGWLSLGVIFVSHMLLLYPTLKATSQWFGPVVTTFRTQGKEAWLTIDDGPTTDTEKILEVLSNAGAHATFFVVGGNARRHPELVRRMIEQGHSIGNHSDTHPSASFWCLPKTKIREQIDRCSNTIRTISGADPVMFRAPVGMKNVLVHPLLEERKMSLIGWSARGFDGVPAEPPTVAARILSSLSPGAIILMHQGRSRPDGTPVSVETIELVVRELKARDYKLVIPRADQLISGRP